VRMGVPLPSLVPRDGPKGSISRGRSNYTLLGS
jgi:hypothetical protein